MLNPGTRLGPYEIVSALGAGGMGEVYRARDTRLQRDVALKVLPESFATDPNRLQRFQAEARAVAALNHPNIQAIHDMGEAAGTHYLVSELLEGETLRERMNAGPVPPNRAIEYAQQIAVGLAAAHDKGIVHRDIKPENLFVTREGRIKILDFGLAKQNPLAAARSASGEEPTLASVQPSPTTPGMVLGTVTYMSPEQVRGDPADHRSDIFSFGAVLFEMVSGRAVFKRDTTAETMTAILKEDPPEFTATVLAPPAFERIARRCIEKLPEQRFQSARDLAFALEALSGSAPAATLVAPSRRKWKFAVAGTIGLVLVAIAAYLVGRRAPVAPGRLQRLTYRRGYVRGARYLPDGKSIVFSAAWDGNPYEVFTSTIGDYNARSLDVKNAMVVGVSAAGEVALLTNIHPIRTTSYMQIGTLAKVSSGGGAPRELLEGVWDADISRDSKQFAVVRTPQGLHQLEYPIGTVLFKTSGYISHPRIAPDGASVAFLEHPVYGDDRGYVTLVDRNGNARRLTPEAGAIEGRLRPCLTSQRPGSVRIVFVLRDGDEGSCRC